MSRLLLLVVLAACGGSSEPAGEGVYVCPMHPAETSTEAGATCGECGMKLELKE